MNARTWTLSTLLLLVIVLPCGRPSAAGAENLENPPTTNFSTRPGAARPGWYLGLATGGAALSLDDAVEERFADLDLDLSRTGTGGGIFVGYSFSNRLNLELRVSGREFSTGRDDIDAHYGELVLEVVAPLLPEARVSPYLAGSMGGAGLGFEGRGIEDRTLVAVQAGFGGGVEVHLSRRFALDFQYRVAVQRYEDEVLELEDGSEETLDFDGSGVSQLWGMRVVFSF